MDLSSLPRWPILFAGETRHSWLKAAARLQSLDERDWWAMVQASPREPERPKQGTSWRGFPQELGDIRTIAPTWRLASAQRRVYCPHCFVRQGNQTRWPTHVSWLDVRQLTCSLHACALVYRDPMRGEDPGHAQCLALPELVEVYTWTQQWKRMDGMTGDAQREGLWRRDLVHMMCRNWTPARSHSAAGLGAWELWRMGWYGQEMSGRLNASEPGRLGVLSAPERLGTLLLAFRTWRYFQSCSADVPRLPPRAWYWLTRRWFHRLEGDTRRQFLSLVSAMEAN
jgi:hypothetical protein